VTGGLPHNLHQNKAPVFLVTYETMLFSGYNKTKIFQIQGLQKKLYTLKRQGYAIYWSIVSVHIVIFLPITDYLMSGAWIEPKMDLVGHLSHQRPCTA